MDNDAFGAFFDRAPKFNPLIANGFAHHQLSSAPEYIANKFREVEADYFPPELKFIGYEMCSPETTYRVLSNKKHRSKNYYDITRTDVYMVKYMFTWQGNPLGHDVYIFLPYTRPGSWITLKDSQYHIAPVLADITISVTHDGLFIALKLPVKVSRFYHQVVVDDSRELHSVVWSKIHNVKRKSVKTSLAHYLFTKKGLTGTFKEYANCDVIIGRSDEVNKKRYPVEDWVVCKTAVDTYDAQSNHRRVTRRTDVRLAIPRDKWNTLTQGLVAGFYHLADAFPEQVMVDKELDNPTIWKMLLGKVLFDNDAGIAKIIANMDTHLESVDTYLTDVNKRWLEREDVYVNDIYELFAEIIESYSRRASASSDRMSTMYNKRFAVLHYVLGGVISGINRAAFDIHNGRNNKKLTDSAVIDFFRKRIKLNEITALSGEEHKEVSSIGSSTDSLIYKLSMINVLQTNMSKTSPGKSVEVTFGEESVQHASVAEIGNPNVNPEKEPTGRQRTNVYADVDELGVFRRREQHRKLIDDVQENIKR